MPELLAPVADLAMARAAIAGKADAVYVGFPDFNARGRSPRLSFPELEEIIQLCHLHGLRVYIALNVLIFEHEFDELVHPLTQVLQMNPDAFIVQDPGLARWLAELDVRIHASTQMTVADPDSLAFYARLPFARFVLAREMSIDRIKETAEKARALQREVECFIQGALCVSYSGQCLTSESFGGGSANRGRCAQSCRFLYDVIVDGKPIAFSQYAVSARDLNASSMLDGLTDAGVDCFKIEGRLKEPQYVTASLLYHRNRIEGHQTDSDLHPDLAFSRRSFTGWLGGVNHQELVDPQIQTHVGEYIGELEQAGRNEILVRSDRDDIVPGDGIAIVNSDGSRAGGIVLRVKRRDPFLSLQLRKPIPLRISEGQSRVFRNHSTAFEKRIRSISSQLPGVAVHITASASPGRPLVVRFRDSEGHTVTVQSKSPCLPARSSPLTEELLKKELGALGGTPYTMQSFSFESDEPVFLHQREWKECRRNAVEQLNALRTGKTSIAESRVSNVLAELRQTNISALPPKKPSLHLLVRDPEHLAVLQPGEVESVTLDFEYGRHLQQSLDLLRHRGIRTGIATYRVMDDGEDLKRIEKHRPDIVLVRNAGALQRLKNYSGQLIGDFSLNVANSITATWFLEAAGLERIVPSLDLNAAELMQMLEAIPSGRIEIILHQRIASFHMEYCLYAKYLSNGANHRSCGIPCHSHRLALRDPQGELHPVYTDFACRNTMYRSRPQSMAGYLEHLMKRDVQDFRIDLLDESPEQVRRLIDLYTSLLASPASGKEVIRKEGWSEGQLRRPERTIKKRKEARR